MTLSETDLALESASGCVEHNFSGPSGLVSL
jgi:hypothetical protein